MSCRGHICRPAAHLILVRFYGLRAVAFRLGGASIVSTVESHLYLRRSRGSPWIKSFIMTMSWLASAFGPGATLPAVIRTRAVGASLKPIAKEDGFDHPAEPERT